MVSKSLILRIEENMEEYPGMRSEMDFVRKGLTTKYGHEKIHYNKSFEHYVNVCYCLLKG